MKTKICSKCNVEKPIDCFAERKNKDGKISRRGVCKGCYNKWRRERDGQFK